MYKGTKQNYSMETSMYQLGYLTRNEFCRQFANLYDECYMTLNVHQLVHLSDSVRILGPLYTHSCFPFEDKKWFSSEDNQRNSKH